MLDTILFDLDGTLLDTNQLIMDTFKEVLGNNYKDLLLDEVMLKSFIGPSLHETFSRFSNDENEIKRLMDEYRVFNIANHKKYVKPYNNAIKLLEELSNNYKLGIVSTKRLEVILIGLGLFDMEKYFDVIVAAETVEKKKPDPSGIYYAMDKLNSKNAIYIGDNKSDILAGKNANLKTIGVSYSYKLEDLIKSNPDYMIDDLIEVLDIVKNL